MRHVAFVVDVLFVLAMSVVTWWRAEDQSTTGTILATRQNGFGLFSLGKQTLALWQIGRLALVTCLYIIRATASRLASP